MGSHNLLPGVQAGDIGPKMGFANTDNGYIKFDHFRQPKSALLSRYVQITDDGTFSAIGGKNSSKIAFGSMLSTRLGLIY